MVDTAKAAGYVPIAMAAQDAWVPAFYMTEIVGGYGGPELYEEHLSRQVPWNDPRYVESGKLFQDLCTRGAFPEGFLGLPYDEATSMFGRGDAAMYFMGSWETAAVLNTAGDKAENISVFLLPAYKPGYSGVRSYQVDASWAISADCGNPE